MSKSDEIEPIYFTLKKICELINREFYLNGDDIIVPSTLAWWKKKDLINYGIIGNKSKANTEQYNKIRGFVYLHVFLGIKLSKITNTHKHLEQLITFPNTKHYLHKYIPLYANKK